MTRYFVSRHPGAIAWATAQDLHIDQYLPHLDLAKVQAGDTIIGSLPVRLAAKVCAAGAAYWHLNLDLPADMRGRELSEQEMAQFGACVEPFEVRPLSKQESQLRMAQASLQRLVPEGIRLSDELIAYTRAENFREEQE